MYGIKRETSITFKGPVESDEREYQPNTWQGRLDRWLNQAASQGTVLVLVLLDLLVVTALLLINQNVIRNPRTQDAHVNTSSYATNQQNGDPAIQTAERALHIVQIVILSLFLFEVTLRIFAKLKSLVNDPLQIFDCLVVLVTFTLYLALSAALPQPTAAYACGYIIVLRLWRLGRLYHAIIYPVKEMASRDKLFYVNAQKFTEDKLRKAREELEEIRKENDRLKEQIKMIEKTSNYIVSTANIGRSFTSPDVHIYADAATDTTEGQTSIPEGSYKSLSLPNGNTRTNNPNNHFISNERPDALPTGMGTRVPDVVENTPEHSVCSSSDLREDFGSQNLQLTVEEQQQYVADIDVQIEVKDNKKELPDSVANSSETCTSQVPNSAHLVSKTHTNGTDDESVPTVRRNIISCATAESISTAEPSLSQQTSGTLIQSTTMPSSSQKPYTSTTNEDVKMNNGAKLENEAVNVFNNEKEKLVQVGHPGNEFAYLNLGFDTSLTPEELLEVHRISQVPFHDSSHTKEDGNIPMTDL